MAGPQASAEAPREVVAADCGRYGGDEVTLRIRHDLRSVPREPESRGVAVGARHPHTVAGITLHQTACADITDADRLLGVPAHAWVHRDGSVSLLHYGTALVEHGHALNGGTVGIEIACRAAGTEGKTSTFWRSRREKSGYTDDGGKWHAPKTYAELVAEATDAQLEAACELVRYYCGRFVATGYDVAADDGTGIWADYNIRGIWAHRQGHDSRTSDPGSRIWRGVAIPMTRELGLADVSGMVLGTGTAIPKAWKTPYPVRHNAAANRVG